MSTVCTVNRKASVVEQLQYKGSVPQCLRYMRLDEDSWAMEAGKYLFCQLIVLFTMSVNLLQGNVARPGECTVIL